MGADRFTERELDYIFALYNKGNSVKRISAITGRSYNGIANRIREAFWTCSQTRRKNYETKRANSRFSEAFVLSGYLLSFLLWKPAYVEEKGRKYVVSNWKNTKEDYKNGNLRNGFISNVK